MRELANYEVGEYRSYKTIVNCRFGRILKITLNFDNLLEELTELTERCNLYGHSALQGKDTD